jgi:hypothetical protein
VFDPAGGNTSMAAGTFRQINNHSPSHCVFSFSILELYFTRPQYMPTNVDIPGECINGVRNPERIPNLQLKPVSRVVIQPNFLHAESDSKKNGKQKNQRHTIVALLIFDRNSLGNPLCNRQLLYLFMVAVTTPKSFM